MYIWKQQLGESSSKNFENYTRKTTKKSKQLTQFKTPDLENRSRILFSSFLIIYIHPSQK